MWSWLNTFRHKPAAKARTHLLLAALMWTIVGAMLLTVGAHWLLAAPLWLIIPLLALACSNWSLYRLDCSKHTSYSNAPRHV